MTDELNVQFLADPEGQSFWFLNSLTTIKATTESTGGAFSMVHQVFPPGFVTPYHRHHTEDEVFYILEGELTFFSNGERITGRAGSYLFLPHGLPHGFRNDSSGVAKVLFFGMPGHEFISFLRDVGEPATEQVLPSPVPVDRIKMMTIAAKHGIDTLGPLPG